MFGLEFRLGFGLELGLGLRLVLWARFFSLNYDMSARTEPVPSLFLSFFFDLYLISSPEQNRGRGSPPQC